VLFNEPKLLKSQPLRRAVQIGVGFSALQRAEIAEIGRGRYARSQPNRCFSALQRAEIAEMSISLTGTDC